MSRVNGEITARALRMPALRRRCRRGSVLGMRPWLMVLVSALACNPPREDDGAPATECIEGTYLTCTNFGPEDFDFDAAGLTGAAGEEARACVQLHFCSMVFGRDYGAGSESEREWQGWLRKHPLPLADDFKARFRYEPEVAWTCADWLKSDLGNVEENADRWARVLHLAYQAGEETIRERDAHEAAGGCYAAFLEDPGFGASVPRITPHRATEAKKLEGSAQWILSTELDAVE